MSVREVVIPVNRLAQLRGDVDVSDPPTVADGAIEYLQRTILPGGIPDDWVHGPPPVGGGGGDVPSSRTISTTAPLTGGGDLSANRTLAVSAATAVADGIMSA